MNHNDPKEVLAWVKEQARSFSTNFPNGQDVSGLTYTLYTMPCMRFHLEACLLAEILHVRGAKIVVIDPRFDEYKHNVRCLPELVVEDGLGYEEHLEIEAEPQADIAGWLAEIGRLSPAPFKDRATAHHAKVAADKAAKEAEKRAEENAVATALATLENDSKLDKATRDAIKLLVSHGKKE